jgi:hypothetical protein
MTRWSRTPLPEKRLFLSWQSADDTATSREFIIARIQSRHHCLNTLRPPHPPAGKSTHPDHAPSPEACPSCKDESPIHPNPHRPATPASPTPCLSRTMPGKTMLRSALRRGAGAGKDGQANLYRRKILVHFQGSSLPSAPNGLHSSRMGSSQEV